MARFLNPYNFVRPLPAPSAEPDNPEQRLLWRCPPPPHDRYTGLTGRITCTMKAVTPVFVSDTPEVDDMRGHKTYRFFQVDGQDMIPATSLRGPIRSLFEIATNSCMGVFEGQQLSYREDPLEAQGLIPAKIYRLGDTWRVKLLTGTSYINYKPVTDRSGKIVSPRYAPKRDVEDERGRLRVVLYAAWLPRYHNWKGGENVAVDGFRHGQVCYAELRREPHRRRPFFFWEVQPPLYRTLEEVPSNVQAVKGILCLTNKNITRKHDERFFFTDIPKQDALDFPVASEKVRRYNDSIIQMRAYHQAAMEKRKKDGRRLDYFNRDEDAFSYYLYADEDEVLITTTNRLISNDDFSYPVYVKLDYDETSQEDFVSYIAPVSIPRVPENRTLWEVLAKNPNFQHLLPPEEYSELSLADRVFGWVNQKAAEDDQYVAYKGRVRFSNALPNPIEPKTDGEMSLSILSSPKPTTTLFYADLPGGVPDGNTTDDDLRYGKQQVMLRGRKVYRHHGKSYREDEAKKLPHADNSDQNRTIRNPHAPGTKYTFTIDFENLQPIELGALLWVLRLKDGEAFKGYHRIGYAKPLGLGSLETVSLGVETIQIPARYQNDFEDFQNGFTELDGSIWETYIGVFQGHMAEMYGTESFYDLENIVDLGTLLSEPDLPDHIRIHYPRPRLERSRDGKNYEWFRNNKYEEARYALPYPLFDDEGFPYLGRWQDDDRRWHAEIVDE